MAPSTAPRMPKPKRNAFRFFELPPELRIKIYELSYTVDRTIDLQTNHAARLTRLFEQMLVCRQFHHEASNIFFRVNTFRIFSTDHPRSKKPMLGRVPKYAREAMTTLELRLGPDWRRPPPTWTISPKLKLAQCKKLRLLKVFVELDPEDSPICRDWMTTRTSYTDFSVTSLAAILSATPICEVRFDGFPSVNQNGPLLRALRIVCAEKGVQTSYGPIRGWKHADEQDEVTKQGIGMLTKSFSHIALAIPAF